MTEAMGWELEEAPTPREALECLGLLPGRVLLESVGGEAGFSFLSAEPSLVLRVRDRRVQVEGTPLPGMNPEGSDIFQALTELQRASSVSLRPASGPTPFPGGIVGYLGYESGDVLERLPPPPPDDVGLPEAWLGVYDWALLWDRGGERCRIAGTALPGRSPQELESRMRAVTARLERGAAPRADEADPGPGTPPRIHSSLDRRSFMEGVERIRRYIRAGDVFQANLTRRITVETSLDAQELYRRLVRESPSPYAAFLDTGEGHVASISPEGFLSVRNRQVETRPIKGTAPRSPDPEEDRLLRERLLASEKDRAENVMIVDLLRNDLSRVCKDGSVEVPHLLVPETHPTVHHLVSRVRGRLRAEVGVGDLLGATFPGGSVTGAPKIRAMEILRELEPVRRGVYTGALGVIGFDGDLELSIAIRTAVLRDGRAHYGTGGGITLASDPEAEWQETVDKARAFLRAVGGDP